MQRNRGVQGLAGEGPLKGADSELAPAISFALVIGIT